MQWHKVLLQGADISAGRHILLQSEFESLFMIFGAPKEAGMFTCIRYDHPDYPADVYYFSPEASHIAESLIRRYRGEECSAPKRSEVTPLVGREGLDDIPFSAD